ncbi:hypothetical protein [Actinoplanes couchii]|uniref:Tat pathway signal sequence domain protein n=1 Tax=Actinoplanes couchii TaxID=403638 RepID=A0ABQ3XQN0_9ACTN|nr:hypothetical protein [Actinoplanes couchii]MDR6317501.1 hypothetical protein [Actinoplanes couchii]GID60804.1 hypothetical protein Aco03nite_092080 [Actinoplanes couchii]
MTGKKKRRAVIALAAISTGFVTAITPSSAAFAACDARPKVTTQYTFKDKKHTSLATNLKSAWVEGPANITYTKTATSTVSAQVTATVSAEAGIVFAKASSSLGVTVGASYSKSEQWSYSKNVPKGKDGQLRMYHDALGFTVTKKVWDGSRCDFRHVYTSKVVAPKKTGEDYWKLVTRKS